MESKEPLVSIITISYNSEKTIRRTIESVLDQSYKNIEYIIVDGKSNDSTVETIKKYGDTFKNKNIKYKWISEKDKGIADAFNKGLKLATGDLIALLNSDDWYEKDTIDNVVKYHRQENADFYYGNIYMHGKEGSSKKLLEGKEFSDQVVKYVMPINHPTMFATKKVILTNGEYSSKYKYAMDYDYLLRMHKKGFKGKYISNLFVNMQDGGAHQANYYQTLKEVNHISVSHGGNRVLAYLLRNYTFLNQKLFRFPLAKWMRMIGLIKE